MLLCDSRIQVQEPCSDHAGKANAGYRRPTVQHDIHMIGLNFKDIDTMYNTLRQLKVIYHSANEHSMRVPQPLNICLRIYAYCSV